MRLNEGQRKLWADKLMDLANIGAGALIFGQVVAPTNTSTYLVISAIVGYFVIVTIAMWFMRK